MRPVLSSARAGNLLSCQFPFGHTNKNNNKRSNNNNNNNNNCNDTISTTTKYYYFNLGNLVNFQFLGPLSNFLHEMDSAEFFLRQTNVSHSFSPCVIFLLCVDFCWCGKFQFEIVLCLPFVSIVII